MTCIRADRRGRTISGFICIDDGPLTDPNPGCPESARHTPTPEGYVAASVWAEEMLATHTQEKCPGCGLWAVWVPRETRADA